MKKTRSDPVKKITTLIFDWGGVFTTGKFTQCILEVLASRRKITISDKTEENIESKSEEMASCCLRNIYKRYCETRAYEYECG